MKTIAIAAAILLGAIGFACAQDANAPPAKPDPAAKAARDADCSKQADAKSLHMKERKKFLSDCKKGM